MERCPRCLARHGTVVELEEHPTPPRLRPKTSAARGHFARPEVSEAAQPL
jgi:hypothetical protein